MAILFGVLHPFRNQLLLHAGSRTVTTYRRVDCGKRMGDKRFAVHRFSRLVPRSAGQP